MIPKTGFEITITQNLPWVATTTLEGTFEGEVDSAATTMKVTFDKVSVKADGTNYALNLGGGTGFESHVHCFTKHYNNSRESHFSRSEAVAS